MKLGQELPSRLIPYSVNAINMELFDIPEMKLLSKASAIDSIKYMIEALSNVIDMDANQLTDGDFHYLFALQRILGYSDHPLAVHWKCDGVVFNEDSGLKREFTLEQLKEMTTNYNNASDADKSNFQNPHELLVTSNSCFLDNEADVLNSDLNVIQIPENGVLDNRLVWPRMNTYADALEMKKDPEKVNLVDAARWVPGETMNEKFKNLEDGGIALFKIACAADSGLAHGYNKHITKYCTRCGKAHIGSVNVDAAMFFHL